MKIFWLAAVLLAVMTPSANSGEPRRVQTLSVTVENIADFEERLPPGSMYMMCRQRNCNYAPRYDPPPPKYLPPSRDDWRDYRTPRSSREYEYQDFRSQYRYRYER